MADTFTDVRVLDNFYQTSGYYPMPVVLVSTLSEQGQTNLGPYSLCFPYIVTGGRDHAMLLISRPDSNTARNIIRTGVCSLNFIPDKRRYLKNCVQLGFPGEETQEKMKHSIFTLLPATRTGAPPRDCPGFPDIVAEAVQVFECTWDDTQPLQPIPTSPAAHLVLRIDKLLLKKKWRDALRSGRRFPRLPIDFGFRDNTRFWFSTHSRPRAEPIPKDKASSIETVHYACTRFDPDIQWEREACEKIVKVPGIFLKRVISGVVEQAKQEGISVITPEFMDRVRDKRSGEKK